MKPEDEELSRLRKARDEARNALKSRVEHAVSLASPSGLTQRVRREVTVRAQSVATQAIEIAADNRGIMVGTVSALMLWLGRRRLLDAATTLHRFWREHRAGEDQGSQEN